MIELLVVVAILGLLAGLLLPAIASVKRKAQTAHCANNLRQIGLAAMGYTNDHEDRLPFAWIDHFDTRVNSFHALLQPLITSTPFDGYGDFGRGVYTCAARRKEPLVSINPFRVSYAMNGYNSFSFPGPETLKITTVSDPSRTFLAADVSYAHNHPSVLTNTANRVGYKHNGLANTLLMDGHLDAFRESTANNVIFSF